MSRFGRIASLGAFVVAALLIVPAAFGVRAFVITGGSMGSSIPVGSLAFSTAVHVDELRQGDVVTFRPADGRTVTHRVAGRDGAGIVTRGDANRAADPWRVTDATQPRRVAFHVPVAGYAVAVARRLALPVLLALLGSLLLVSGVRDARKVARA